ncbi:MAG: methionine aminopeptidase [Cyanobacteria bacterium RYN_339]|nr:methionine aminopeptidase [Cyanobacteria bacterium RYN_339]
MKPRLIRKASELITEPHERAAMRHAGRLVAAAHAAVRAAVVPGVSTRELDAIAEQVIVSGGGRPAFKGYGGFPNAVCASPNEIVVHGLPNRRKLLAGEIISLDIGAEVDGHYGDSAWTYAIGEVAPAVQRLLAVAEASLYAGLAAAWAGNCVEDISAAIQDVVEPAGFSLVREYVGHGIGRVLHGSPQVPNYRTGSRGPLLQAGQAIAIEPMVNLGAAEVYTKKDGWAVATRDGSWSAHFEHTIIVTGGEPEITTFVMA